MIAGIGVDLVSVERIRDVVARHGERARRRLFTLRELADCDGRADSEQCLAARFAAKEAAFKALGTGQGPGMRWTDVEVISGDSGRPRLELSARTAERARELGVSHAHLTLSHDGGSACAVVVMEGPDLSF